MIVCTGLLAVSGILRTQARRRGSRHPGHCRRRPTCYYDYAVDRRRHLRHRAWLVAAGRGATRAGSRDPGPGRAPSPSPRMPGPVGSVRAGTSHAGSPLGSVRAGGANCVLPPPRAGGSCPASAPSGVQPGPHAGVEDRHRTAPLGPGASRRASRGGALLGPTLPDADRRLCPPRASCRESRVRSGPRAGAPERHGAAQLGDRRRAPRAPQECARGPGPCPADRLRIRVTAGAPLYVLARDRRSRRGPESESAVGAGWQPAMSHGDSATVSGDVSLSAVLVTRRPAARRAVPRRQWSPGDRAGPWAVQVGPGLRPARDCCTARAAGGGTDGPWPAPHAGLGAAGAGRGPGRRAGQPPALGPRVGPSSRSPLGCGPGLHAFPFH